MNTTTMMLGKGANPLARRTAFDWVFAALVLGATAFAFHHYGARMDFYETWILAGAAPSLIAIGWFWRPLQPLSLGVGVAPCWRSRCTAAPPTTSAPTSLTAKTPSC
jgi:hypothetical protein